MSDHHSLPSETDGDMRTILLRLLAGGMSALLMAVALYTVLAVQPEWSYHYIASVLLIPLLSIGLLRTALQGDFNREVEQDPPSVPEPILPTHPVVRVLTGILGVLMFPLALGSTFDSLQRGSPDVFSSLVLWLTSAGFFVEHAWTGRHAIMARFVKKHSTILGVAVGVVFIVDAIRDGNPAGLGLGLSLICFFLVAMVWQRYVMSIPAHSD